MYVITVFSKVYQFLAFQPGELPVPRKSKENQLWGNFDFQDFIVDNWLYLGGVLLIIVLLIIYKMENKRSERKEKEQQQRN